MTTRFLKVSGIIVLMSCFFINTFAQDAATEAKKTYNVIKYANSVTGLNDVYTLPLANYQRILAVGDRNIAQLKQNKDAQISPVDCNAMLIDNNEIYNYKNRIDSVLPFDQKGNVDRLVNQAENMSQKVTVWCGRFSSYFSQGQYKNDGGCSQYAILKDSLTNSIRLASLAWNTASQTAIRAANDAEINLLRYNKRAEFVVPMKTDITTFKELLNMFGTGSIDYAQVRTKNQSFGNSLNYDKDLGGKDLSKLSDPSYQTVYQDFYKYCIDGATYIDVLTQKMEQKADSKEIQNAYNQVRTAYSSAINAFNTFAKQK